MELHITGKNVEVTDWLKQYVEKKIGRLDRYLPGIQETRVELVTQNSRRAGDRQVPNDPRTAFTHVYGAPGLSTCTVLSR